jgi:hypothetical protein
MTRMETTHNAFAIRSFREGDEESIARLFNQHTASFVGPARMTAESWRQQFRQQTWCAPSVDADPKCVRVAERGGTLVGYAVTDYEPRFRTQSALVQELCVEAGDGSAEIARALLEDVEAEARARAKHVLVLELSAEDGLAAAAAADCDFETAEDGAGVFMAAVIDLKRFLGEIADELTRRLSTGNMCDWRGTVRLSSGDQAAYLRIHGGQVRPLATDNPDISAELRWSALARLLLGRMSAAEAYLQDLLSVDAADRAEALRLLETLFPRLPLYLPRAQWW